MRPAIGSTQALNAGARRWLRGLLLCTLFAALHGTLGAWVVPLIANEPTVQICTPQGMQWVALDEGASSAEEQPAGCVWAGAHVAMAPGLDVGYPPTAVPDFHAPGLQQVRAMHLPDNILRVLLMSAMRAPPARWT
ncbi:hypothetical protein [Hydrogenophaga sp.]|uniref:hypothetical protein n=1 Tax=Hydrogenophaga sp. TaxID=1904254 RepID=UPI0025B9AC1A|nr:hypothetical protein [Hydrogenophaga sp.]